MKKYSRLPQRYLEPQLIEAAPKVLPLSKVQHIIDCMRPCMMEHKECLLAKGKTHEESFYVYTQVFMNVLMKKFEIATWKILDATPSTYYVSIKEFAATHHSTSAKVLKTLQEIPYGGLYLKDIGGQWYFHRNILRFLCSVLNPTVDTDSVHTGRWNHAKQNLEQLDEEPTAFFN